MLDRRAVKAARRRLGEVLPRPSGAVSEEEFAEAIDRGGAAGLSDSELCTLIAERCGHAP